MCAVGVVVSDEKNLLSLGEDELRYVHGPWMRSIDCCLRSVGGTSKFQQVASSRLNESPICKAVLACCQSFLLFFLSRQQRSITGHSFGFRFCTVQDWDLSLISAVWGFVRDHSAKFPLARLFGLSCQYVRSSVPATANKLAFYSTAA